MIFLQPLALLGLAFALVPPLLHLFQRRHPPDVEFPAVRYVRQTEREAERSIRLRHLALLLLRVAAVLLLVLAAARPVVPARVGGLHSATALVLVLDNSLSSGAVVGGRRVLDDLAARARETLRAARGGDALWLVGADALARRGSRSELATLVDSLAPDARRLDLGEAVGLAARLVRAAGYTQAEIHVLTDLQRTALLRGGGGGVVPDSEAAGLSLVVYHPAGDPPANRGVAQARAEPATWVLGAGSVSGRIVGSTPAAARGAVTVRLDGREVARAVAGAGEAFTARVPGTGPGWHAGEVALDADELRGDDVRPFAVRAAAPAGVAVESGADPGRFVGEALEVLAGAGQVRLGPAGEVRIGETARPGGGIVFPPRDPVQLGAANRALDAVGAQWRFGGRVETADTIAAPGIQGLGGARVLRRYRLVPAGPERPGSVLARVGGEPWLVRAGRAVIVASRLVPEETELPLLASFVPAVASLVLRVARGEEGVVSAAPGEALALPPGVTGLATPGGVERVGAGALAPVTPGVFALLAAADTVGALVVAPDQRESDLARAGEAEVAAAFPGARLRVVSSPRAYAAARFAGAGGSDLAPWLLVAALVVLVAESLTASGVRRGGARGGG